MSCCEMCAQFQIYATTDEEGKAVNHPLLFAYPFFSEALTIVVAATEEAVSLLLGRLSSLSCLII